jgi:hypothetical protein
MALSPCVLPFLLAPGAPLRDLAPNSSVVLAQLVLGVPGPVDRLSQIATLRPIRQVPSQLLQLGQSYHIPPRKSRGSPLQDGLAGRAVAGGHGNP